MIKRRRNLKSKRFNVNSLPILALVLILGLSIGFSAFQEILLINDTIATVTPQLRTVLYSASASSTRSSAMSKGITTTTNTVSDTVVLPESDSSVTYEVQVKNLGNVEQGILDIDMDNEDLEVNLESGYDYKEKICDDNDSTQCTLGATKTIYMTVNYAPNGYDSSTSQDDKNFTLTLDIESYSSITYIDIVGTYQDEIINGDTLEVDFDANAPNYVSITMDSNALTSSDYTYAGGVLTIPDVDGDIVVTGLAEQQCLVTNVKSFDACTYVDNDSSSSITVGDKVTCGTESFYVIQDLGQGSTVKMLAEWNLNVSEPGNFIVGNVDYGPYSYTYCPSTVGYQDSHVRGDKYPLVSDYAKVISVEYNGQTQAAYIPYGLLKFDNVTQGNYGYWTTGANHDLNTSTYTACNDYPCYVYDSNSTLKDFVDDYVTLLNTAVRNAYASGRLISYAELNSIGCTYQGLANQSCNNAPSWVYQTSYWSGTAYDEQGLYSVHASSDPEILMSYFTTDIMYGLRPLIEISSGAITLAQ